MVKLIFKLFLFLENLQIGFFTFLISSFNQKLKFETFTQFLDFQDFDQYFLKDSLRKYWSKSWKSKNRVNVSNFNFWLKEDIRNVKNTICRFLRNKKSLKINFTKKLFFATYIWPQKYGFGSKIMFFWKSSKNRVLRLQTPKKSLKNNFLTPIFFLEKYRTSAPKWYRGFLKIRVG